MAALSMSESKPQLRILYRNRRRGIETGQREDWDRRICDGLLNLPILRPGFRISAFWPFDGEPDLRPALRTLHEQGHSVFLPLIPRQAGASLEMHRWEPDSELASGELGILEPAARDATPPGDLDLVLVPLVAWDPQGHRLGMGAGYYDRYLGSVMGQSRPVRAGVAYSVQRSDSLPTDDWDVPLHSILTEAGWTRFTPPGCPDPTQERT